MPEPLQDRSRDCHAQIDVGYGPGPAAQAEPGTLDHFLVERYCLFARDQRVVVDLGGRDLPAPRRAVDLEVVQPPLLVEALDLTTLRRGSGVRT
jgi:Uncharacterized conserved protein (COG2071)